MSEEHPSATLLRYQKDPCAFVRDVLGMTGNYPKQDAVLQSIVDNPRTAVRAANGAGKSVLFAEAIIWFAGCFPNSKVVSTASTNRQVEEQLWGEVSKAYRQSKIPLGGVLLNKKLEFPAINSMAIGFSTDDPGLYEGWHAESILILIDEAKSVSPAIFEAADRVMSSGKLIRFLVGSSPGGPTGPFYECFHRRAHLYSKHHISAHDSPYIKKDWIEEMIREHGEDSAFVQSSVFGNFPLDDSDGGLISLSKLMMLHENPPQECGEELRGGIDFAAGGRDENVMVVFKGNKQIMLDCWHEPDTMVTCGRVINNIKKLGIKPEAINADADGLGGPIIDRLWEQGYNVCRCKNGSASSDRSRYFNWGAETWMNVKNEIEKRQIILINDDRLNYQLTNRWQKIRSDGAIQLESKEDARKRNVPSPDRADALVLARASSLAIDDIKRDKAKTDFYKESLRRQNLRRAGYR